MKQKKEVLIEKPRLVYQNKEKKSIKNLGCKKCESLAWRFSI